MHLMYYASPDGRRVYTLKKATPEGKPTISAHPARFSPDDKFSRHRVTLKKRCVLRPRPRPRARARARASARAAGSATPLRAPP